LTEGEERSIEAVTRDLNDAHSVSSNFGDIQVRMQSYLRASDYISMDPATVEEVQEAWDLFQTFAGRLRDACVSHTLSQSRDAMLTEQEVLVGTIVAKSSQPRKRKDTMAKVCLSVYFGTAQFPRY
jgi:RNA-dependent RNA polymerase